MGRFRRRLVFKLESGIRSGHPTPGPSVSMTLRLAQDALHSGNRCWLLGILGWSGRGAHPAPDPSVSMTLRLAQDALHSGICCWLLIGFGLEQKHLGRRLGFLLAQFTASSLRMSI